jgi:hypothetical protein
MFLKEAIAMWNPLYRLVSLPYIRKYDKLAQPVFGP